ncbi:hypothetical protein BOW53_12305 [Solemya pervernicosa gill symbiont]|uniref:SnoaL-like domain-containing protein n=1 Tax=Solemya pervernicosa gill symbiont TaxID=642797 RepID=A0A1T2L2B5_9GAMM|nr:hypothetical protein [Solemya pervernicosa gill symbiont]OOZ39237.1 hypothetical protein BOW53_12305 [Solemya pervernicosa gill symbiont]
MDNAAKNRLKAGLSGVDHPEGFFQSPELLVDLYPRLFSEKRFTEWRQLFADKAVMARSEAGTEAWVEPIDAALPEQEEYGEENSRFEELWFNTRIERSGNIAVIFANYRFTVDHEVREGVDVLTLIGDARGWKIVSLVYEQHALREINCE